MQTLRGPGIELKFQVPNARRAALVSEVARGSAGCEPTSLAAVYLDTPDRRLARAGIVWRMRREGRRWFQTLQAFGTSELDRFEHEVIRTNVRHDATLHAGTKLGQRLAAVLHDSGREGVEVTVRFQARFRRMSRRIRTRGAVVDVRFDEGRLIGGGLHQQISEIEFGLVSGSQVALVDLAERWRKRHGLIFDPHSKTERGHALADGVRHPPLRKAMRTKYATDADAVGAFDTVAAECLAQIARNTIGIIDGSPDLAVEHVHQLRVGIRRLRSALRSFCGWIDEPPTGLVDALRDLFAALGRVRDGDVLDGGVAAALAAVGAPPVAFAANREALDLAGALRSEGTQRMLLAWIRWRIALTERSAIPVLPPGETATGQPAAEGAAPSPAGSPSLETGAVAPDRPRKQPRPLALRAARRLRRVHQRLSAGSRMFDALEEAALHALRKRVKGQRYAVEFFAPLLRRKDTASYLRALATVQDQMGELNDLMVARERYQQTVASDPAAWFALGWIAARIAEVRKGAKPALEKFANMQAPRPRRTAEQADSGRDRRQDCDGTTRTKTDR
jgi:inorganic triphosphatase YgiF